MEQREKRRGDGRGQKEEIRSRGREKAQGSGPGVGKGWRGCETGRAFKAGELGLGRIQKQRAFLVLEGPLEIKSWRCSTFPRKNAQYHRRWRA